MDQDTLINQVRLLTADVGSSTIFDDTILTDSQIATYLTLNGGNPRLAAADALEAIAVSEVLVSKVIRTQDLTTDGAKVADALMRLAALRRRQAQDEADAGDDGVFAVAALPLSTRRPPEHTNHTVWGL